MHIKALVLLTFLASCESPVFSSWAKMQSWFSSEGEEQKRTKALTATLYEQEDAYHGLHKNEEQKRVAERSQLLYDITPLPRELIAIVTDYERQKVVSPGYPITAFVLLADGSMVSAGKENGSIQIWNSNGSLIKELQGHTKSVKALATLMVDKKEILMSGGSDGAFHVWEDFLTPCKSVKSVVLPGIEIGAIIPLYGTVVATGFNQNGTIGIVVRDIQKEGPPTKKFFIHPPKENDNIYAMAFVPQQNWIVSAGSRDYFKVWDLASSGESFYRIFSGRGFLSRLFSTPNIYALLALPDGRIVSGSEDAGIRIFDPVTKELVRTLSGHKGEVRSLLLLQPTLLVSGASDGVLKIWDLLKTKDECIKTFSGHTKSITGLAKDPTDKTGKIFFSASADGTIRRWSLD